MSELPSQQPLSAGSDGENPGGFSHITALDGIRGAAVLLVLIDHLFWSNDHTGSSFLDFVSAIRSSAYIGVNLFFALSGFLITGILLDTLEFPRFFRTFYARRALRIFPLYYGSLIFLLLLTKPMHFVWSGWQYYYLTYTANLAVNRANAPLNLGIFNINHFWSLQVEEQFYLFWPLVLYRFRRLETVLRISLVSCAIILGIRIFLMAMRNHPGFTSIYLPYGPTFSCADNILYGCVLCVALRTCWRETVLGWAKRVLAASAIVLLVAGILNKGLYWANDSFLPTRLFIPTLGFSLVGISCAALIAMTLRSGSKTQLLFQNRTLRFFGKYSYGIYVFHFSVVGAVSASLRLFLNSHLHSKAASVFLDGIATGALSVAVALVSYHLIEVRFLHLKRFFSYSRSATTRSSLKAV
jgi:peptidoglycan/LPS O-acetylase OafA/YrhL